MFSRSLDPEGWTGNWKSGGKKMILVKDDFVEIEGTDQDLCVELTMIIDTLLTTGTKK